MAVRRVPLVLAVLTSIGAASAWAQSPSMPPGTVVYGPPYPAQLAPLPSGGSATSYFSPESVGYPGATPAACPAPCQASPPPFTPFMLGDFVGFVANQFSDVKIAEGESPRPVDRVFFKYNYYNNVEPERWQGPTQSIHNVDLYRYSFGFERTFFDQTVSIGVRIPFDVIDAEPKNFLAPDPVTGALHVATGTGLNDPSFGNVSAILKAIIWQDKETGSLLSAGATISVPTASTKLINPGQSTLAYVQPFGGFIFSRGDFFVQGFSSITAPVASAESIVWFNDLGVGFYAYRTHAASIAPMLEVHVASPLRQADPTVNDFGVFDNLEVHNVVDVTLGASAELANGAVIGVGMSLPMTGPRPFDWEGIAQFNYRF
jgi:hypothetical protein